MISALLSSSRFPISSVISFANNSASSRKILANPSITRLRSANDTNFHFRNASSAFVMAAFIAFALSGSKPLSFSLVAGLMLSMDMMALG